MPYDDFSSNKPTIPMQTPNWKASITINGRVIDVQVTARTYWDAEELLCRMYNVSKNQISNIREIMPELNSSGGSSGGSSGDGGVNIVGAFFGIIALCVVGSCQAIFDGNDSKSPTVPIEQQSVEQVDTREVSSYDDEEDYEEYLDEDYVEGYEEEYENKPSVTNVVISKTITEETEEDSEQKIPAHLSVSSYFQE